MSTLLTFEVYIRTYKSCKYYLCKLTEKNKCLLTKLSTVMVVALRTINKRFCAIRFMLLRSMAFSGRACGKPSGNSKFQEQIIIMK